MLSVCTLKSASQAKNYFENGDYYIDSSKTNEWFGKGATELGLTGELDFKTFEQVLSGHLPNGVIMAKGYGKDGKPTRRPGYDLTFSAPKSLSIVALWLGDERLVNAHQESVKQTLEFIEKHHMAARLTGNVTHKTGNMVASMHLHTDSRELDPNLHTHCVIANSTKDKDKWRSVFSEDFYKQKMDLGFYYRNILAGKLHELGYHYEVKSSDGLLEISGVPQSLIKLFSVRREQIKAKLQEMNNQGSKSASIANLLTRVAKKNISFEEARKTWDYLAEKSGFVKQDLQQIINDAKQRGSIKPRELSLVIDEVFNKSLKHLSERSAVFSVKDFLKIAERYSVGTNVNRAHLEIKIAKFVKQSKLIVHENKWITTSAARDAELELIQSVKTNNQQNWKILGIGATFITRWCYQDPQQRQLATELLKATNRASIMIATDREHVADFYKKFNKISTINCHSHHLFPNKNKANLFEQQTKIKTNNIYGYMQYAKHLIDTKQINRNSGSHLWVVHFSENLSTQDVTTILEQSQKLNFKVQFVRYEHENLSDKPGDPTRYLQNDLPTYILGDPKYIDVVEQSDKVFNKLSNNQQLIAINDDEKRKIYAIDWLRNHDKGIIYTTSNVERQQIINSFRQDLLDSGKLTNTILVPQLRNIYLTGAERLDVSNYMPGDYLYFSQDLRNKEFRKGEYWQIKAINPERQLMLEHEGKDRECTLNQSIARVTKVYICNQREISVGEHIIYQGANTKQLRKGDSLEISNTDLGVVTAKTNNAVVQLDLNQLSNAHWDYAYCKTISSAIRDRANDGLILVDHRKLQHIDWRTFNTLRYNLNSFQVVTNDADQLKHKLIQNSGVQIDAHKLRSNEISKPNTSIYAKQQAAISQITGNKEQNIQTNNEQLLNSNFILACKRIEYAMTLLSERDCLFTKQQIVSNANYIGVEHADLQQAFELAVQEKVIIEVGKNNNERVFAARELVELEKACIAMNQNGLNQVPQIISADAKEITDLKNHQTLTKGQKTAIIDLLTSEHRFAAIHGAPGVGKTTLLKYAKRLGRDAGYDFIGLAHTAAAKENLREKTTEIGNDFKSAGIESKTIAKFIIEAKAAIKHDYEHAKSMYANTIILVDEASMLSIRDTYEIKKITEQLNTRCITLGDTKQNPSIEAGKQFHMELAHNLPTSVVATNVRLNDRYSFERLQALYKGDLDRTFKMLENNLIEIKDKDQRLKTMAEMYLQYPREESLAMLPLNQDRKQFNNYVREILKTRNELRGESISVDVLVSKDIPQMAKLNALAYRVGDYIHFNSSVWDRGTNIIDKDSYCYVKSVADNQLHLIRNDGNEVRFNPEKQYNMQRTIAVYKLETREIMSGDTIRWRKNDEARNIFNSHDATVISVDKNFNQIRVKLDNKEIITLDLNKYSDRHFDYAYGVTSFSAQGLDKPYTYGHMEGITHDESGNLKNNAPIYTNTPSLLVMLSRGDNFTLVVNDKNSVISAVKQHVDMNKSGLQLLLQDKWQQMDGQLQQRIFEIDGIAKVTPQYLAKVSQEQEIAHSNENPIRKTSEPGSKRFEIQELKLRLNSMGSEFAKHILGQPTRRSTATTLYFGSKKGSLGVTIAGDKTGLWQDFATGEGGDLITLAETQMSLSKREAIQYCAEFVGMDRDLTDYTPIVKQPKLSESAEFNEQQLKSIKYVQRLYADKQLSGVKDTIAEKYLQSRGINNVISRDLFFHPSIQETDSKQFMRALVGFSRDKDQQVQAAQVTFLNPNGTKVKHLDVPKRTHGPFRGTFGCSVHSGNQKGTLVLAEGIETALSVAQAFPEYEVRATFGIANFSKVVVDASIQKVIICADHDVNNFQTEKQIDKAVDLLQSKNLVVTVAKPYLEGQDFNDVLQQKGTDEVRKQIGNYKHNSYEFNQANGKEQLKQIYQLRRVYLNTEELPSSIAQDYLRNNYGINNYLSPDIRFKSSCYHPNLKSYYPALVLPGRDSVGKIVSLTNVYLSKDMNRLEYGYNVYNMHLRKISKGLIENSTIELSKDSSLSHAYISAGNNSIEAGFIIKSLNVNSNIYVSEILSNLGNISIPSNIKSVTIIADNHGRDIYSKQALISAMNTLISRGLEVKLSLPITHNLDIPISLHHVYNNQDKSLAETTINKSINITDVNQLQSREEPLQVTFLSEQKKQNTSSSNNQINIDNEYLVRQNMGFVKDIER